MRPYIYIFIAVLIITLAINIQSVNADSPDNQLYEKVLKTYVNEGLVNYSDLKTNSQDLNQYLQQTSQITKEEFSKWNTSKQLAFLINLYNAQTLSLIVDNYPVKSIKDIASDSGGPWEQPIVNLFGNKISLNALEHEVIRKNYPEARVHFALVCAALGCPELINTPYQSAILDKQLDDQTRVFLMDSSKNSIDTSTEVLRLSPIFDWFKEDFISKSGSVIEFVNPYFSNQATEEFKIEYTNYDWSLNDYSAEKI